jgi:hypothetical protein
MSERQSSITPIVSVVMPTYNGARFLREAVGSILNQTFRDHELIVVDDASTDSSPHILAEFNDDRMVIITNDRNLGIAGATNRGLAAARGEYVALQDHDDISLPRRLDVQVDFLRSHAKVSLVGSAATLIDEKGNAYDEYREPEDDIDLKWEVMFRCPFRHTTVMIRRKELLDIGGYSGDLENGSASDYDLLSRITMRSQVQNLREPLVLWRRHAEATSIRYQESQDKWRNAISARNIAAVVGLVADKAAEPQTSLANQQYGSLRAFFLMQAGQLPTIPPEEVIAGARLVADIQSVFYRAYRFPVSAVARHRRRTAWRCGKHAIALAARAPWDWRSRIRMSMAGVGCLFGAFHMHG